MLVNISKANVGERFELNELSNGATAVIDLTGRLVCYNKNGKPDGNDWDWVRKDCQKK